MRSRLARLLPAALLLLPLLLCAPGALAEDAESPDLPLAKVLLFSSGVGYFEHQADVDGNATLELTFSVDDVNDLLKSMVVQDLGEGRISTVTYGSRDPVAKALQSFAVDLAGNLSLAQLLEQLRGEAVHVETPLPVTGTILGVETRAQRVRDEVIHTSWLSLLTDEGIKCLSFDTIRSVRLLDERLDKEMRAALKILSTGRDARKKTVTFEFLGEGSRPIRVGYIQETPVWKTSYRLVLEDEAEPYLQGWAIVENTTDRDWEDVDLALVSGRPISYTMNLYQPLYAFRPAVQPTVQAGVTPQSYERELQELKAEVMDKAKDAAPSRRMRGRSGGRPAESGARRPGSPPAPQADSLDLRRGVVSAASAAEVGELFRYQIAEKVTLQRQRSAMLPILNDAVKGRKVSIYDPSAHAKHPLNGLHLENSTDLHICQGPVTVFDGGAYAGDALIGDMPPGAKRLISYAMDLEVEVAQEGRTTPDELVSVRIIKGAMLANYVRRRDRAYIARNDDKKPRTLLISYPYDANWKLLAPQDPYEKTRNQYRFALTLPPGETKRLQVSEEQIVKQEMSLGRLRGDRIAYFLKAPQVSADVVAVLKQLVQKQAALDALGVQFRAMGAQIKTISQEQDRIRKNMEQIDHGSDLYARYLTKFSKQEDEIESLRGKMSELQARIQVETKALEDWLTSLLVK